MVGEYRGRCRAPNGRDGIGAHLVRNDGGGIRNWGRRHSTERDGMALKLGGGK